MRKLLYLTWLGVCVVGLMEQSVVADTVLWKVVGDKGSQDFSAIRLNTATGQSWLDDAGTWSTIPETGVAPTLEEVGTYDCIVYYVNATWYGIRWNVRTGQSWKAIGRKWVDIGLVQN